MWRLSICNVIYGSYLSFPFSKSSVKASSMVGTVRVGLWPNRVEHRHIYLAAVTISSQATSAMYARQVLRVQSCGTRTAPVFRLRRVCGAEVAALKANHLVVTLINTLFSLAVAEHVDTCAARPGGGCLETAASHHPEVWFTVPPSEVVLLSVVLFAFARWQQLTHRLVCFPFHQVAGRATEVTVHPEQ